MWERNEMETPRGHFEYFVKGQGEPLCITHLYSEFNELGTYFAEPFTEHFTVYLVNLKDAGNSSSAEEEDELSMEESVKDLESIRAGLGYSQWGFAGHSTGGMLGLVYATMAPQSLHKVMVGGATASKEYMDHPESMYSNKSPLNARLKEIFSLLKSPTASKEERTKASQEWTNMSLYRPKKREVYFSKPSSGKVVPRRLDYYSFYDLPQFDIRNDLKNVTVPTYVFCGQHDAQCPVVFSEEIYNLLETATFYRFLESNHFPFLEESVVFGGMVASFKDV